MTEWSILLGPPGTGKTTSLIDIVRDELNAGTPPDRIGFVTFTVRAANEAIERMTEEFKLVRNDLPYFRTLHSFAMRSTGINSSNMLEGDKLTAFADWIGEELSGRKFVDGDWQNFSRGDRLLFMDGVARIKRIPLRQLYEHDHDDLDWSIVERFSRGLDEYKKHNRIVDYTDLLTLFVDQQRPPNLEVLLVDESQDLSMLQWDMVRILAEKCRSVTVAGDDDQGIFAWAGADVDTLIDLQGNVRVLDQSYRVPIKIQTVAQEVINRVKHRRPKEWKPRDDEGVVKRVMGIDYIDFMSNPSMMVLARNRFQLRPIEDQMKRIGILYLRDGESSISHKLIESVVTWERLRRREQPQKVKDVIQAYELMATGSGVKRGFKKLPGMNPEQLVTIDNLKTDGGLMREDEWYYALERMPQWERGYLRRCRMNKERLTLPPRVNLSTIHGSKGGQANTVVLLTDLAPRTYREMYRDPDAENRVLYVAVTRAREELILVHPQTPRNYGI